MALHGTGNPLDDVMHDRSVDSLRTRRYHVEKHQPHRPQLMVCLGARRAVTLEQRTDTAGFESRLRVTSLHKLAILCLFIAVNVEQWPLIYHRHRRLVSQWFVTWSGSFDDNLPSKYCHCPTYQSVYGIERPGHLGMLSLLVKTTPSSARSTQYCFSPKEGRKR